jgi:hypothetical protein
VRLLDGAGNAGGDGEALKTCRLWLAMDIVTTKLDTSMGGTVEGDVCEGDAGDSLASEAKVSAAPAFSTAGDKATVAFDTRRRWPGDKLPSRTDMPRG